MPLPQSIFFFFSLLFLSNNCSAYLPLSTTTTTSTSPFQSVLKRLKPTNKPTNNNNDARARPPTSPKDLENAFAEVMWRMQMLQEEDSHGSRFGKTLPKELQRLLTQKSTTVAPSSIPQAGNGLFATRDISAGSIVTFYPVHAMGIRFADGSCFVHSKINHDPTSSAYVLSLTGKQRPILGTLDLEQHFGEGSMGFVDADPKRQIQGGAAWQGHWINDGAVIEKNTTPEEAVMEYYAASLKAQNAVFCPFGPAPMIAAVATQDIAKGQEIFTCYGRSYWLAAMMMAKQQPQRHDDGEDLSSWSLRTDDIVATEQMVARAIHEATEYVASLYEEEEKQLFRAFYYDLA